MSKKNIIRKKLVALTTSLVFVAGVAGVSVALAAITFSNTSMTGDASFSSLVGATSTTWDLGSGNTLSLQTTNNGPITTGTGTVTLAGALVLNGGFAPSSSIVVARGGTGAASFTGNGVLFGSSTAALQVTAAGTSGQLLQANAAGTPVFVTLSGDGTIAAGGALTLTATNTNLTTLGNISSIDRLAAGTLTIGNTTTTGITISRVGMTTTIAGGLTVNGTFGSTVSALTLSTTTNQLVLGTSTTVTINSVAPASSRTYTLLDNGSTSPAFVVAPTSTTATSALFASVTAGAPGFRGILITDLPTQTGTGNIVLATAPTITSPFILTNVKDTNGNVILDVSSTASSVNDIALSNAATGGSPMLTASGTDSNISLNFVPKGSGGIKINGGTAIVKHLSATTSITFATIASSSCSNANVTVTGANTGDMALAAPNPVANGVDTASTTWSSWVSAAGTVTIRVCNPTTTSTVSIAAQTWRADVWQH